jgi:hypothetical protein
MVVHAERIGRQLGEEPWVLGLGLGVRRWVGGGWTRGSGLLPPSPAAQRQNRQPPPATRGAARAAAGPVKPLVKPRSNPGQTHRHDLGHSDAR